MYITERKTKERFIEEAKLLHGSKYDYSKVEYVNNITKVCIICPVHGEFWQTPKQHLRGQGCPLCGKEKLKEKRNRKKQTDKTRRVKLKQITNDGGRNFTTELFVEFLKEKYGNLYDYSKVNYVNCHEKVCVICPVHGEFWKIPNDLLHKNTGCPKCLREYKSKKFSLGKELFIEKANGIFHDIYDYQNVNYVNNSTKVEIICQKHGPFYCTPQNHLAGRGCPVCKAESNVYENRLYSFLKTIFDESEIIRQCKPIFLSNNKSFDFFIEKYKIAIEHQGSQHFFVNYFNNEEKLKKCVVNDLCKIKECKENNVHLLHFTYELNKIPENCEYELILTEEELKNKILKIIEDVKNNRY